MHVEQRIGRIDRIGQKYPKVRIINLAYADTVEAIIFALSGPSISFRGSWEENLQPILSKLPKEFEAAALKHRQDREKGRHQAVQNLQALVAETETAGFRHR